MLDSYLFWMLVVSTILLFPLYRLLHIIEPIKRLHPPRIPNDVHQLAAKFKLGEDVKMVRIVDISRTGMAVDIDKADYLKIAKHDQIRFEVFNQRDDARSLNLLSSRVRHRNFPESLRLAYEFDSPLKNEDLFVLLESINWDKDSEISSSRLIKVV